jgi:hypothetical protein
MSQRLCGEMYLDHILFEAQQTGSDFSLGVSRFVTLHLNLTTPSTSLYLSLAQAGCLKRVKHHLFLQEGPVVVGAVQQRGPLGVVHQQLEGVAQQLHRRVPAPQTAAQVRGACHH